MGAEWQRVSNKSEIVTFLLQIREGGGRRRRKEGAGEGLCRVMEGVEGKIVNNF